MKIHYYIVLNLRHSQKFAPLLNNLILMWFLSSASFAYILSVSCRSVFGCHLHHFLFV